MSEYEAEALQTQAQSAGVSFVEQVLLGKRMTAQQLAVFASRAFGTPLLDLASFDIDQIHKDYVDLKIAQARRVLPLYKRSNKLYVAISDPANLQALDEVRFKTNLVPEPIVVEDDKLGQAIAKVVESTRRDAEGHGEPRGHGGRPRGRRAARAVDRGRLRRRGRAGRQVHPEAPDRRDRRRRVGHPLRAVREVLPRPLPRRRHPDGDRAAAARDQGQGRVAHQGHLAGSTSPRSACRRTAG